MLRQFASVWKPASRLKADDRGSVAILFAIAILPLFLGISLVIDLRRASNLRLNLQNVADNAALAAVTASANGAADSDAVAMANTVWASNSALLANTSNSIGTPTINFVNSNGVATATVIYAATQQTSFGGSVGLPSVGTSGSAMARAYKTVAVQNGLSGTGSMYGDPHVIGADGKKFIIRCTAGNWYDILSDAGIEVNASCFHSTTWNQDMVNQVEVMIGSHTILFSRPALDSSFNPVTTFDPSAVVVDGTAQTTALGQTTSFFGGQASYTYGSSDWSSEYANVLTVTTPIYTVSVSYGANGGLITIVASGAGQCGVPGGAWGLTLAGMDDSNSSDYQVPSATYTEYEFSRGTCATATLGPRLIQ